MLHILIADDHSLIRAGLKQLLQDYNNTTVIEAENARQLMKKLSAHKVDVIVLDISMPGKSGLEALKDIQTLYPHIPVIMLSVYSEDQYAIRAFKLGAAAYLTKETAPELLIDAIKQVSNGKKYILPSQAEFLIKAMQNNEQKPLDTLSDREFQVLRLLGKGLSISEISKKICLSEKTVSTYKSRLCKKLKLSSTADVVRFAIRNNLVD